MSNLKLVRRVVAAICFTLVTLLFLDFTNTLHGIFGWLAKIQFIPALLALHVAVVIILLLSTLIFGRIYCSVICPLGIYQDVISKISSSRKKKKFRFRYKPALTVVRLVVLVTFVIAFIAGIGSIVALLEPYSIYGRIASNLFAPVWQCGNNILAYFAERADSYAFYTTDVWIKSIATFSLSIATFVIITVLAWRDGRIYCNSVCPVGTILGYLSKFSMFKVVIDTEKCNSCGLCSMSCKSSCIDSKNKIIDYSRCVACFNCGDRCKKGAISYVRASKVKNSKTPKAKSKSSESSRRNFIATSAMLLTSAAVKAQEEKVDGGLSVIIDRKIPNRNTPIVPAGAKGVKNFATRCTGCQLCVSVCPNQVLRPSSSLITFMQPEMSYEKGYCRPECTSCSDVCPAGAISPITKEQKSATSIGHAVWIEKNCLVTNEKDIECGNCAKHCPTGAIQMVAKDVNDDKSKKIPVVDIEKCIGCGACEYVCPAEPFSAIYVEGNSRHRSI